MKQLSLYNYLTWKNLTLSLVQRTRSSPLKRSESVTQKSGICIYYVFYIFLHHIFSVSILDGQIISIFPKQILCYGFYLKSQSLLQKKCCCFYNSKAKLISCLLWKVKKKIRQWVWKLFWSIIQLKPGYNLDHISLQILEVEMARSFVREFFFTCKSGEKQGPKYQNAGVFLKYYFSLAESIKF